jgi:hypothetical protein
MLIYNVTTKVDWSIHNDWVYWMKQEHIPDLLQTGLFFDSRFVRVLEMEEDEGPTYAVQYFAHTIEEYQQYIRDFSDTMRKKAMERWGNQFISFRSLMQSVD